MAFHFKFLHYLTAIVIIIFQLLAPVHSRPLTSLDGITLGDLLEKQYPADISVDDATIGNTKWMNGVDTNDLSLNQLVQLIRRLKSQKKLDRQQRIKKQICYVQELC